MISVTVICKNEEKNIERCLKSLLWADEIILVDAGSTDRTRDLAGAYTDNIFVKKWEGFAKQREYSLSLAKNDWVLAIDADEVVTEELAAEILEIIKRDIVKESGFKIPRKSFFLNKWTKHCGWYPGYQLRLFRKSAAIITNRLVHEGYEVSGETGILKNDLLHYTVTNISEYMDKVNHYSTLQAIEKKDLKKITMLNFVFTAPKAFIGQFIFKGGFLDGIHGAMVSAFHTITRVLTVMKIWELQNKEKEK